MTKKVLLSCYDVEIQKRIQEDFFMGISMIS